MPLFLSRGNVEHPVTSSSAVTGIASPQTDPDPDPDRDGPIASVPSGIELSSRPPAAAASAPASSCAKGGTSQSPEPRGCAASWMPPTETDAALTPSSSPTLN
ncbi:hypothetical protein FDECE_7005 [Fusarium decemcellulare]|nr:hypothetical protein FDECE_7005 [Fusarium decemcellulare]